MNESAVTVPPAESGYPVRVDVPYPESINRWLPLVKWLLVIPHWVVLYFVGIAYSIITFIAFFAILFTRKYPRDLFDFAVGYRRWLLNVTSYAALFRDEYPPFSLKAGEYPASLEVDYPEDMNRWLPLVKWLLAIPHYIVLLFLFIAWGVMTLIALFMILFTAKYPRPWFDFGAGVMRWSERVNDYVYLKTDVYPPFNLNP